MSVGTFDNPGAGFFPLCIGIWISAFSIISLVLTRPYQTQVRKPQSIVQGNLLLVISALLGYVLILQVVGFLLSTFLLMTFLLRVVEPRKWPVVFVISMLGSLSQWLFFKMWLEIPLPRGIFL